MADLVLLLLSLPFVLQLPVSPAPPQPVVQVPVVPVPVQQTPVLPINPVGYKLGPGDVVSVDVWTGNESLRETITVAADGSILIPFLINKIVTVTDMDSIELRTLLLEELRKTYKNPTVQVIQTGFNSKRAMLVGDTRSGAFTVAGNTKLLDFVIANGGFSPNANLAEVQINRPGGQIVANVLNALLGDTNANPRIEPGDIVYIPSLQAVSNKLFVISEGKSAQVLQTAEKLHLLDALSRSSGISAGVRLDGINVIRFNPKDRKTEVLVVKFNDIWDKADLSVNIPLENGDIVFIPKGRLQKANEVITAISPILNLIQNTILYNILRSGGQ